MRDVFKSWRRKVGVLTLLMACMLMGMWLRSLSCLDVLGNVRIMNTTPRLFSTQHAVVIVTEHCTETWNTYAAWDTLPVNQNPLLEKPIHWWFLLMSFGLGTLQEEEGIADLGSKPEHYFTTTFYYITVPYWSIVIPLTLLSAWLLLLKPRQSSPTKSSEFLTSGAA